MSTNENMSTDENMSLKQKIPIVHLERFSLVKIFAHKIFTTQNLTVCNVEAHAKSVWGSELV